MTPLEAARRKFTADPRPMTDEIALALMNGLLPEGGNEETRPEAA